MINGTGVVNGLKVSIVNNKVYITPGMAIDSCGREIIVCQDKIEEINWDSEKTSFVICIMHDECKDGSTEVFPIACDGETKEECKRIRDSFKILAVPKNQINDQEHTCQLDEEGHDEEENDIRSKTLHDYICEKFTALETTGASKCGCVALATVTKTEDKEGNIKVTLDEGSTCSIRKLVYSNTLLYDLIHCFHKDMPHVSDISWNHNKIYELDFVKNGISVTFDKKVKNVTTDTFQVNVVLFEEMSSYQYTKYIPGIVKPDKTDPQKYTFIPMNDWVIDNISGSSIIKNHGGKIIITLKSDFILDEKTDVALDGNFIGNSLPSGKGVQGVDFVSWFSVNPVPREITIPQGESDE